MTQEEKQLLLKDLCARLPYGVNYECMYGSYKGVQELNPIKLQDIIDNDWIDGITPYLRPMSSMTEGEIDEYYSIQQRAILIEFYRYDEGYEKHIDLPYFEILVDWLNSHHFDYRGLIEKGLALEAPEGMYNV